MNTTQQDDKMLIAQCRELRSKMIAVVGRQGGHLASSLGAVELCVALHHCFSIGKEDALFFDVGHQAYAHKLLSEREGAFERLRAADGCSGFPNPDESACDPVYAGHAGVALAQAIGAAKAMERQGRAGHAIAVVGDGAMGCGIFWEALNNIGSLDGRLIIILNDNQMSISPSGGIQRRILNRLLVWRFYNRLRSNISNRHSGVVTRFLRRIKQALKSFFLPSSSLFQEFGLRYIGPVDGNEITELYGLLSKLPKDKPVLLHLLTKKGKGYPPAEAEPEAFHCLSKASGMPVNAKKSPSLTFSQSFGNAMVALAEKHHEVVAVSAAMLSGTGLKEFAKLYPDRCYDVGIAEEYAVAFASGLACRGMRPVVALYSTFLQRALDNVYHDVCLNNLPVIFCVDRVGVVPDGPTHHGIYALPFLRHLPNLIIMAPADDGEMTAMLELAYHLNQPVLLRYPRATCPASPVPFQPIEVGKGVILRGGDAADAIIWAVGAEVTRAMKLADTLEKEIPQWRVSVINPRFLLPFDHALAQRLASSHHIILDDYTQAGLTQCVREALVETPVHGRILPFVWPSDTLIPHGDMADLRAKFHLTIEDIAAEIKTSLL